MDNLINKILLKWKNKLEHKDYRVREKFAKYLGENKGIKYGPELLVYLLDDKNTLVKSQALESLMLVGNKKHLNKVLPLLDDDDEIVRICAIECIGELGKKKAGKLVVKHLDDPYDAARRSAGIIIGESGDKTLIEFLEKRLTKEKSDLAKVGLLEGLYLLGQEKRLKEILKLFDSPRYHVRCSLANSLYLLVNGKNKKIIKESLRTALSKEKTVAARGDIKNTLDDMS